MTQVKNINLITVLYQPDILNEVKSILQAYREKAYKNKQSYQPD